MIFFLRLKFSPEVNRLNRCVLHRNHLVKGAIVPLLDIQRSTGPFQTNNVPARYGFLPWIFSFKFASGCARKAHPGGFILPQYVHAVPGGGEVTGVVLYVTHFESH